MALRDIDSFNVANDPRSRSISTFGLASKFRPVVLSGQLDLAHFNPVHVILDGEYVRNIAWNRNDIAAKISVNSNSGRPGSRLRRDSQLVRRFTPAATRAGSRA